MSDPFAIVALTGIGINIASSLSEKIASRWLKKPLQDADGRMSGLLKTLKIVPETFNDKLQKCLKQAVEIYFDEHPQYKITGIVRFLQSDAVQAHVAGYFIADPVVESDVVSDTLDEIFHLSAVGHILAQRRGIDFEKILPDFLDACEKALLSHTDEPELLLVYINFNHARNIQNTIRSEAQRVVEHVDERFEGFERKRSATPVNDLFLYTGWAETITDDAEESVSHLRRAFNAGMTEQVNVELHRLKEPKRWSGIKENTKARILAFEASLVLQQNDDFDGALQLLNEARKHEIVDEISAIHALILYKRESPEAALDFLQDQQDRRSQNIKLSILIGLQRFDEANIFLKSFNQPDAETYRLAAVLHLAQRNLSEAQANIRYAIERENEWLSIRFVDAIIKYWSALSLAALPPYLVAWPEPVDPVLIKSDPESLQLLREAQQTFTDLLPFAETPWVQEPSAWLLAALSIDPDKQAEAKKHCEQLISQHPDYIPAVVWNNIRGFGIDLTHSIDLLEEHIGSGKTEISIVLTLLDCYVSLGAFGKALDVLERSESVIKEVDEALWYFRKMHIYLAQGDFDALAATLTSVDLSPEEKSRLRELQLYGYALSQNDWLPLADHCKERYEETGEPYLLFKACEAMYRAEKWQDIVDYSDELLQSIYTYETSRIVIEATSQTGKYEVCLELIDQHIERFSSLQTNPSIEQLRIHCFDQLGQTDEALKHADALASVHPNEVNFTNLAVLHHKYGNRDELISVGTKVRDLMSVSPEAILFIAELVALESEPLAIDLWEKLDHETIPDDLVPPTLLLGLRLGLDDRTKQIFSRMQVLASEKRSGVISGSLSDLIGELQKRSQFANEQWIEYLNGKIPIHVLADFGLASLFEVYHVQLQSNLTKLKPSEKFILMARHGSHPILTITSDDISNTYLQVDITSLLLSHFLGILDSVERVFGGRLYLPASIHELLTSMEARLVPNNPERIKAAKQIKYILNNTGKNIKVSGDLPQPKETLLYLITEIGELQTRLYTFALDQSGYVVSFMPLRKPGLQLELAEVTEEVKNRFLSRRAVADILHVKGYLNQKKYDAIHPLVAGEPTISDQVLETINRGTVVICDRGLAINLFEIGLLNAALKFFNLYITQEEKQETETLIHIDQQYRNFRDSLKNLNRWVNRGRKQGNFHLITSQKRYPDLDPNTKSLASIFDSSLNVDGIQLRWIDDRYVNSFPHHDSGIVGINEVLKFLIVASEITETEYYGYLHKLRKANVRYIPVEVNEVVHYLDQANIHEGGVEATEELETLKRYVSICMIKHEYLQRPSQNNASNSNGEVFFFSHIMHLFADALKVIWQSERSIDHCIAYSNWLVSNILFDYAALINPSSEAVQHTRSFHLIMANLILLSFQPLERNQAFHAWLRLRILHTRFKYDHSFAKGIAEYIRHFFQDVRKQQIDKQPEQELEVIISLQRIYSNLPEEIQAVLEKDRKFLEDLGFTIGSFIHIDGREYLETVFREAVHLAVNHGEATLISTSDESNKLKCINTGDRVSIYFEDKADAQTRPLNIIMPEVLLDDEVKQIEAIERKKSMLDCSKQEFEELLGNFVNHSGPERMKILERLWNRSANRYYLELYQYVKNSKQLAWEHFLPPSVEGIIRYIRQTPSTLADLNQTSTLTSEQLLVDLGPVESLKRLSSAPIKLPLTILDEFKALNFKDRKDAVRQLIHFDGSPLSKLHLIRLLHYLSDENPSYQRLAHRIANSILSETGFNELAAYFSILSWVARVIDRIPDYSQHSEQEKLMAIWIHAHHLYVVLQTRFRSQDLVAIFNETDQQMSAYEQYLKSEDYWFDIAFPLRVNGLRFLIMGLGYGFGGASTLTDNIVRSKLETLAFMFEENKVLPQHHLLLATTQMENVLQSFLGDDLSHLASNLFSEDLSELLSEDFRKSIVKSVIDDLHYHDHTDLNSWIILERIFSDLPVYAEIRTSLVDLIFSLDSSKLLESSHDSWWIYMRFAIAQAKHKKDDQYLQALTANLLEASLIFGHTVFSSQKEEDEVAAGLINLAFYMFITVYSHNTQMDKMAEILSEMCQNWDSVLEHTYNLLSYLHEIIPINEFDPLLPLYIRLRAET